MTFSLRLISRLFCAATICVALAGCSTATRQKQTTSNNSVSGSSADIETVKYANNKEGLSGKLKQNYVDFSFAYPEDWVLKETGRQPEAKNFVKVERSLDDTSKGEFTQENFAVGYLKTTGNARQDATLFPKVTRQLSAEFQKGFSNYKKVSEGPTRIGALNGYEFRFESLEKSSQKGDVKLWGRVVLLPKPGTRQGVSLVMLASSLSPDVKSAADLGVKGQLPTILKSFTFEKK